MVVEKRIKDPHIHGDFDQDANVIQWKVFSTNGAGIIGELYQEVKIKKFKKLN